MTPAMTDYVELLEDSIDSLSHPVFAPLKNEA